MMVTVPAQFEKSQPAKHVITVPRMCVGDFNRSATIPCGSSKSIVFYVIDRFEQQNTDQGYPKECFEGGQPENAVNTGNQSDLYEYCLNHFIVQGEDVPSGLLHSLSFDPPSTRPTHEYRSDPEKIDRFALTCRGWILFRGNISMMTSIVFHNEMHVQ